MYESPIKIIESAIDSFQKSLIKEKEDAIIFEVQRSLGVAVDEGELLRALRYDRFQYDKGYADGRADAMAELVRCKDCIYFWNDEQMYPNHCSKHGVLLKVYKDNFCSYGERKLENG